MSKKKLKKLSGKSKSDQSDVSPKSILESANQIWLAGLGAFAKAQEEGEKIFDSLVKEGSELESKSRKITASAAEDVREAVGSSVSKIQSKASQSWDRLERVFEDRVAKALGALGVPTAKDIQDLSARVDELHKAVKAYKETEADAEETAPAKPRKKAVRKKKTATIKAVETPVVKKTVRKKKTSKKVAAKSDDQ